MKFKKNQQTHRRLIIISLDAVGSKDLPLMSTLPNFSRFIRQAALCANVTSVYPSLTYPAHTSIVTGRLPKNHGIVDNTLLQPKRRNPDWMWQRKYVRGTTLYDEAIKEGWKVASLLWPVTAKSKIQYNLPEIFANRPWQNQIMVSAMNGTLGYELDLNSRFGRLRDGIHQPELDDFVQASALYTIGEYQPDMMLIHYTDVDSNRHLYGVHHPKVEDALRRHDKRIGALLEHLEKTGNIEQTTIVVMGDHYQKDTTMIVYLNYLLWQQGLITIKDGVIKEFKVIAKNCGGSCYLYKNARYKNDTEVNHEIDEKMTEVLALIDTDDIYGCAHIYTGKEAGMLGADPRCIAMVEARDGYYFLDGIDTLTEPVDDAKTGKKRATHGYFPMDNSYKTFFMAIGAGIREQVRIPQMNLCDVGVTLAELLGFDLGKVDGKVIQEILW
ncbi:MAG: ectonucleotide pyrophosphatase/phosphodiesterase [Lachnospiraceae bacterium]|nr:ectonucleotide pyrophosphatase/phosphodiesterase [Lachnospiraceae bacterium]